MPLGWAGALLADLDVVLEVAVLALDDGEAEGAGLASVEVLRLNHDPIFDAVAEGEAAGLALAADAVFLRVRCSGEADGEGVAEVAGLALVAAFLRVRCGVAEGEAVAEVSAGLASVLAAAFL